MVRAGEKAGDKATLCPALSVRERARKVVSVRAERVVTTKLLLAVPMVTVAVTLWPRVLLEVTRTATVCPLATVEPVNAAPLTSREPLVTRMGTAMSMPLTVMALLVTAVDGATPLRGAKLNELGVVSAAVTVMVTVSVAEAPRASVTVRVNTRSALAVRPVGAVKVAVAILALVRGTVGEPEVCRQA